jgi:hypothetical protein
MTTDDLEASPETPNQQPFTLLGGPLQRLARRLGLVRDGSNSIALGFAIAVPLWAVLVILALVDGYDPFSFDTIAAHARVLVVIPLLFLAETTFDPRVPDFIGTVSRRAIPMGSLPKLYAQLERTTRWKDSVLPDALCVLAAVALSWLVPLMQIPGTVGYRRDIDAAVPTLAAGWYWAVCLPVFRFLMLRWVWRLCLWFKLLWHVSRLPLQLQASHPDGVAGLGALEIVQGRFVPLVIATSVVMAASLGADIHAGRMTLEAAIAPISGLLLFDGLVFIAPLTLFSPKLVACRVDGISEYGRLAEHYVDDFEMKWLRATAQPGEPLLGSGDIQSLADIGGSLNRVYEMRIAPVSTRLLTQFAIAALVPILPLTLFKYPFTGVAKKLFTMLTGL